MTANAVFETLVPADQPPDHRSGFVAVIGQPNVGKSTLVNTLVGHKVSIISPKPQTTRSRVMGILTSEEFQIIFVDTPGLHRPRHPLGKAMVAAARAAIPDADVILFVVDSSKPPNDEDHFIAQLLRSDARAPVILVLNKMDRLIPDRVEEHTKAYWALIPEHHDWMMTIATEGVNLDKLMESVTELLPTGPRYYPGDQVTDQTEREIAAELIREQVLRLTHAEVPHAAAVTVDEYIERPSGATYISARILVEKDSQKGIVIGKKGTMLRRIGEAARRQIERMTGGQVYIELLVKTRRDWRRDEHELRKLGF